VKRKLFWRKLEESAARIGDYKMISLKGHGSVLYNLKNDLGETQDLSSTKKNILRDVVNEYQAWESQLAQPLWEEGRAWMDVSFHIHERLMQNKEPLYKDPSQKALKKPHSN
jgi:hypothetical protein